MFRLGVIYASGEGTLKDPQQAKYWVKKAYEAGSPEAKKVWDKLNTNLEGCAKYSPLLFGRVAQ
jgi:TPR repeat protein